MEVDFLILADSVQVVDGKLYMLGGGWTTLHAKGVPTTHPLGIGVGFKVPWQETNQVNHVDIGIFSEDGTQIGPNLQGELEMGRPPGIKPGTDQLMIIALNAAIALENLGRYEIQVKVEGQLMKRVYFDVVQATKVRA